MAATSRMAVVILNNASSTTAVNMYDASTAGTAFAGNASFGTRLKSITVETGPTTAPGAVVLAIQMLDANSVATVIEQVTLVNTANTIILDEKIWPTKILPPGCTLQAVMRTAITSGGTVHISIAAVDLTA